MDRFKTSLLVFFLCLLTCQILSVSVYAEKVSRKSIDVVYQYEQLTDGFGNVRTIKVSGYVKNTERRTASAVQIIFLLNWEKRVRDEQKLDFKNIPFNSMKDFEFTIDLGTQPDVLTDVICHIERIKFSKQRAASPLTEHHLIIHDHYSLARLNEEGKDFLNIIKHIQTKHPFRVPIKGEFETTNEYESRINDAENIHFSNLMDELEQRYGQLLGGKNAIIRFLPRSYQNGIVYLSECSAYFQVPLKLGRYNADRQRFENLSMIPRTFPFPLETVLPKTPMQLLHKTGMFFLRNDNFQIPREEARQWRQEDQYLLLELTLRFGVLQDSAYLDDFCVVEKIQLKNCQTGRVIREWSVNP